MQILANYEKKFLCLTHTIKWHNKSSLQNNCHTLPYSLDWQPWMIIFPYRHSPIKSYTGFPPFFLLMTKNGPFPAQSIPP